MKKMLVCALVGFALAGSGYAADIRTAERAFPEHAAQTSRGMCIPIYFDICSGSVYWWTGYNNTEWKDLEDMGLPPAQIGVCFDLNDCADGCQECHHLNSIVWAWKSLTAYGRIDVEIFCADSSCCPVGPPFAAFYDYHVPLNEPWQVLPFEDMELPYPDCRFIAMATVKTPEDCVPYSDDNRGNLQHGCESEWRCTGHSYCYRSVIDYCAVRGYPSPIVVEEEGACSPDGSFHVEWIAYPRVSCYGPTARESSSWSEIKAFFR